jgi:hypothetical protein
MRAQRLGGDQVRPRQGPHVRTTSAQVEVVADVQKGQGGRQACLLAQSLTLH